MKASLRQTAGGAILFDGDIVPGISDAEFTDRAWTETAAVTGGLKASGRGNTLIVKGAQGEFVLRHFVRGGLIGRFVADRYLWLGEDATRAFREWRLLAKMVAMDLPVPRPAAARYLRSGITYRADLLTVRIPGIVALSDRLRRSPGTKEFWRTIGREIASFHKVGVFHADLNAYNVQIDKDDALWLIDFDRGRLRRPGSWQRRNLDRLKRSLQKIKRLDPGLNYSASNWAQLLDGYFSSTRSA